jgi:hypothetical protein
MSWVFRHVLDLTRTYDGRRQPETGLKQVWTCLEFMDIGINLIAKAVCQSGFSYHAANLPLMISTVFNDYIIIIKVQPYMRSDKSWLAPWYMVTRSDLCNRLTLMGIAGWIAARHDSCHCQQSLAQSIQYVQVAVAYSIMGVVFILQNNYNDNWSQRIVLLSFPQPSLPIDSSAWFHFHFVSVRTVQFHTQICNLMFYCIVLTTHAIMRIHDYR